MPDATSMSDLDLPGHRSGDQRLPPFTDKVALATEMSEQCLGPVALDIDARQRLPLDVEGRESNWKLKDLLATDVLHRWARTAGVEFDESTMALRPQDRTHEPGKGPLWIKPQGVQLVAQHESWVVALHHSGTSDELTCVRPRHDEIAAFHDEIGTRLKVRRQRLVLIGT